MGKTVERMCTRIAGSLRCSGETGTLLRSSYASKTENFKSNIRKKQTPPSSSQVSLWEFFLHTLKVLWKKENNATLLTISFCFGKYLFHKQCLWDSMWWVGSYYFKWILEYKTFSVLISPVTKINRYTPQKQRLIQIPRFLRKHTGPRARSPT